jgi:hypothetical protein
MAFFLRFILPFKNFATDYAAQFFIEVGTYFLFFLAIAYKNGNLVFEKGGFVGTAVFL